MDLMRSWIDDDGILLPLSLRDRCAKSVDDLGERGKWAYHKWRRSVTEQISPNRSAIHSHPIRIHPTPLQLSPHPVDEETRRIHLDFVPQNDELAVHPLQDHLVSAT